MTFQVIVYITHVKGHPPLRITSKHTTWKEADEVFEQFHNLYKLGNNCVADVELNELNATQTRKKAHNHVKSDSKTQSESTPNTTAHDDSAKAEKAVVPPRSVEA